MNILDSKVAKQELEEFHLMDKAHNDFVQREKYIKHLLTLSTTNNDFYRKELKHLNEYYKVWI